jgi:DNA-binding transcriptional LysR family regulator
MDRLTAAQVFVEVADRGSLTRAADQLGMSQAMVSRYLAALEGWIGLRLLHRTTRRVSLTEAGMTALPQCRQMVDLAETVRHAAGDQARVAVGKLRIATASSFAEAQLTAAILDFQAAHPRVELEVVVADRPLDLVEDRIDLAIRLTNSLDVGAVARELAVCRSALCAAPAYLSRHGWPRGFEELGAHRFLVHSFGLGKQYRFTRGGRTFEFDVAGSFTTNETAVLRRAVLRGAGIAMLPTYYIAEDLRSGALVRLLPEYEPQTLAVHAVYLSRRHRPLALQLLIDFLVQRFAGELAPWDRDLPGADYGTD